MPAMALFSAAMLCAVLFATAMPAAGA
eukprot:SAG22_NODE_15044_length_358_cov_1.285714_2_plen_26_part_01